MNYRVSTKAEQQIRKLLLQSTEDFGAEAAGRYSELIFVTMKLIADDPELLGSIEVPRVPGIRAFSTRLSRDRVPPADRVRSPRHLIVYRVVDDIVEILGLVHDRMVLSRAARRFIRPARP